MKYIKKNKTVLSALLLLSLACSQASAFSFKSLGSLLPWNKPKTRIGTIRNWMKSHKTAILGTYCTMAVGIIGSILYKEGVRPRHAKEIIEYFGKSSIDKAKEAGKLLCIKNNKLLKACRDGNLETVRQLHQEGANLSYKRKRYTDLVCNFYVEETPIHMASKWGHTDIVQYLVENGVNPESEAINAWKMQRRFTPLSLAVENSRNETAVYLIKHGADINTQIDDDFGQVSLLAIARNKNNTELEKYLLDNGAIVQGNHIPEDTEILELQGMIRTPSSPAYLRQQAIIALLDRLKENPGALTLPEIRDLFAWVPFNRTFIKMLHEHKHAPFVAKNIIIDKNKRCLLEACSIYCRKQEDGEIINTVLANAFETKTKKELEELGDSKLPESIFEIREAILKSSPEDLKAYVKAGKEIKTSFFERMCNRITGFFSKQEPENAPKNKKLAEVLQKHKRRNSVFYEQLVNRAQVFHKLNQAHEKNKMPKEISMHIASYLDENAAQDIVYPQLPGNNKKKYIFNCCK